LKEKILNIHGKVAVIAGAAGGLGRVVTQQLAQEGVSLVLLGRSKDRLDDLLKELDLSAKNHMISTADLSQPEALSETANAALEKFGKIDILINLVGGWAGGETLVDVSVDVIENMLQQHLWTTVYLTKVFVPYLKNSSFGRVLVVSSPTATQPGAKSGPYAIGKAAQEALILTLAKELEGTDATANVIQVKAIDTKYRRDSDPSGKYAGWTTPEEIAGAILYLISDQAKQINGARIPLYR
jgi:NAD(P)-dependent dehydrogenase (short-subunit alcohol dehydrogenase family)